VICPPPEQLVAFVEGRLDAERQVTLESHVDVCGTCRTGLAAVVAVGSSTWSLGRYRIDGVLGAGGMGVVYRGWDPSLARPVAVKVVRSGGDEDLTARLTREAQSLARLNHPNVCQVYDVGRDGDEVWIAMELVEGVTLRGWLAGACTPHEVQSVLLAAGRGLAAAHGAGLVHRDVKPENVLVEHTGRAVVSDFGLARADGDPTATSSGMLVGTPAYMAPEQFDGARADARSDQYAFAVMVHEAMAGARPRPRHVPSAELPPHVRAALSRALADDPAERFATLGELLDGLVEPRRSRKPVAVAVSIIVAIAGLAAGGIALVATKDSAPASAPPSPAPPPPAPAPAVIVDVATDAAAAPTTPIVATPTDAGSAPRLHSAAATRPIAVAAVPVDAPEARGPTPEAAPVDHTPHLGSTPNKPHPRHTTTLAQAQRVFASGYCTLPNAAPVASWSQPVDWGKVVRVADAVVVVTTGRPWQKDAKLYEIAGQRRHYILDGYWGFELYGELGAQPGDMVALCPSEDVTNYQLPDGWSGPVTHTRVAVRVSGPPDEHGVFPAP
jgi:predicted Ser/Thr protein kinase